MPQIKCNTNMFLVLDPRMLTDAGGDVLLTKISNPHKSMAVNFGPGMFQQVDKGSLIIVDNILLETLRSTITRAVDDGSFHRCGVVLLVDEEVLSSETLLMELNLRLRSLWASTTILLQPWNDGIPRSKDGKFATAAITEIAARIDQGIKRLPKLLKTQAVKLLCMHRSWRTVNNRPRAPLKPSLELMTSTEVCTFLRAVGEAPTAQDAVDVWQPTQAPTTAVKRLQKTSPKTPKGRGGSRGGSGGRGGYRGRGGSGRQVFSKILFFFTRDIDTKI